MVSYVSNWSYALRHYKLNMTIYRAPNIESEQLVIRAVVLSFSTLISLAIVAVKMKLWSCEKLIGVDCSCTG